VYNTASQVGVCIPTASNLSSYKPIIVIVIITIIIIIIIIVIIIIIIHLYTWNKPCF
jgi:hypothetical protein